MRVTPSTQTLGARIEGVDLRKLTNEQWRAIEDAFVIHSVLVFPAQHLSDDEQAHFSKHFGRLERGITPRAKRSEIAVLTNINSQTGETHAAGSAAKLFLDGNNYWHTDSSFKQVGAKVSVLSARIIPQVGGDTEFADMRAAYDALDRPTQELLADKVAVHSYRYSQGLIGGTEVLTEDEWRNLPPVEHPVIKIHPQSKRRSLYLGRHAEYIKGMTYEEGRILIDRLNEFSCDPQSPPARVFAHHWSVGDVVMWDNRCVLHRGRPWPAEQKREMHRTTVAGDGPNLWAIE